MKPRSHTNKEGEGNSAETKTNSSYVKKTGNTVFEIYINIYLLPISLFYFLPTNGDGEFLQRGPGGEFCLGSHYEIIFSSKEIDPFVEQQRRT